MQATVDRELLKNHHRVLFLAVVEQAIDDAKESNDAKESCPSIQRQQAKERRQAIEWLLDDEVDFSIICEMAGLDSSYLRQRIAAQCVERSREAGKP